MKTYRYDKPRMGWLLLLATVLLCVTQPALAKKIVRDVQISRTIFLQPVSPEKRVVWLRVRNTTALQDVRAELLQREIEARLVPMGYQVTEDPKLAQYQLQVNIRFSQHVEKSWSAEGCLLAGKIARDVVKEKGRSVVDRNVAALVACGAAAGVGRLFKKVKHGLLLDVRLSERLADSPIVDTVHTSDNTRRGPVELTNLNQTVQSTGGTTQVARRKENFLHHEVAIGASVMGRRLKIPMAAEYLTEDVVTSILNML